MILYMVHVWFAVHTCTWICIQHTHRDLILHVYMVYIHMYVHFSTYMYMYIYMYTNVFLMVTVAKKSQSWRTYSTWCTCTCWNACKKTCIYFLMHMQVLNYIVCTKTHACTYTCTLMYMYNYTCRCSITLIYMYILHTRSSLTTAHTFRAWLKRSRTLAGPTPTNISRNSEPEMLRKGTPASPAVALASRVFPVPGGPDKMAPWRKNKIWV